ncbi:MAG: hypothetical protein ACRC7R_08400 [Sarcina sp.]
MKEFIDILENKIVEDRIDNKEIHEIDNIDENTNKVIENIRNNIEKEKSTN